MRTRPMDLDTTRHDFQFTRQWFRHRNLETFRDYVWPRWGGGKPGLIYLELGNFEGMSLAWMFQHILTHPTSRAVGVDPWLMTTKLSEADMEAVRQRAHHNLAPWMHPIEGTEDWKCRLIRGTSAEALRRMRHRRGFAGIKPGGVDIAMIDGNHFDYAVLDDARLCFDLVKPGGWILFDDVENDIPKDNHVKQGLELWLRELKSRSAAKVWKHKYMECYQKE